MYGQRLLIVNWVMGILSLEDIGGECGSLVALKLENGYRNGDEMHPPHDARHVQT